MADSNDDPETPETFLKSVGATLKAAAGADEELADVLASHILITSPHADAVNRAKAAIVALAEKRAKPPEALDG
jgi:hypothetical protein